MVLFHTPGRVFMADGGGDIGNMIPYDKPDQLFDTCGRYRGMSKPVRVYGIQAQMLANNNKLFTSHIYFDRIKIHLLNFFYGLKLFTYYWNHMSIFT